MIAKARRRKRTSQRQSIDGPTPERLARAGRDGFVQGNDGQGHLRTTILGTLARLHERRAVSDRQYAALTKYNHHWVRGGLEVSLKSVDLDRIFAAEASGAGMPISELMAFHRRRYRQAVQRLGIQRSRIVEMVACEDKDLQSVGMLFGYQSKWRGSEATIKVLCEAGDDLAKLWGH